MTLFTVIKRYMPRSLFWRALLIMLVPLVTLQLIVAAVFIQRHFDGVTRQLATGVALEIRNIIDDTEAAGRLTPQTIEAGQALQLGLEIGTQTAASQGMVRHWYDLSGRTIMETMYEVLERPVYIDLISNHREVRIETPTSAGTLSVVAPRKRMSTSNPHQLLVIMMFSALVLTTISVLFLRNQVRPIARLADAAEAFGKGRSLPYRVSGAEEVRRAGREFISMRQRIERHLEQRTLLLSGVSHDLRTPLTRMRLALATATDAEDLQALGTDIDEMEAMIDSFLAFSRDTAIEDAEDTAPIETLRHVIAETPQAEGRIAYSGPQSSGGRTVSLRVVAFRRALQNLINNALRYGAR